MLGLIGKRQTPEPSTTQAAGDTLPPPAKAVAMETVPAGAASAGAAEQSPPPQAQAELQSYWMGLMAKGVAAPTAPAPMDTRTGATQAASLPATTDAPSQTAVQHTASVPAAGTGTVTLEEGTHLQVSEEMSAEKPLCPELVYETIINLHQAFSVACDLHKVMHCERPSSLGRWPSRVRIYWLFI